MCMIGDDDFWTLYREHHRTARQTHPCGECDRTIEAGEQYFVGDGVSDGAWVTYKMCAHCYEATRWLLVACSGWVYTAVEADLAEHVIGEEDYLRSAPLTRLLRWMRADWRNRAGELRPLDEVQAVRRKATEAYHASLARTVAA